jgi:phage host-nuclease inhibitor protein Gam
MMDEDTHFQDAPEAPEPADDGFRLDSDDKVEWALRKIGAWDAEYARVKAHSESILKRIASEKESFLARFQVDLEEYTRQKIEGGKRRSHETVYGTLAFRKVPPTLSVVDKDAALEWAREHDPTSIQQTLNVKAYSDRAKLDLQQNGEILPGVELKPERESFSIRFKAED